MLSDSSTLSCKFAVLFNIFTRVFICSDIFIYICLCINSIIIKVKKIASDGDEKFPTRHFLKSWFFNSPFRSLRIVNMYKSVMEMEFQGHSIVWLPIPYLVKITYRNYQKQNREVSETSED